MFLTNVRPRAVDSGGGKKPSHRLFEDGHVDGLGDVGVHARGDAVLYVVGEGVGRHRDDGDGLAERVSAAADGLRRLVAVHVRHLNVHQDGVVFAGLDHLEGLDKLRAVGADRAARAVHLKDDLENFGVERVVLRAEEAHPAEHRGAAYLRCGVRAHAADGDLEIREEGDAGNGAHELEAEARIFQLAAAKNIARRLDLVLERCKLIKVRRQRPAVGVQKRFVVGDADGAVAHGSI